jgi:hypothetical protein
VLRVVDPIEDAVEAPLSMPALVIGGVTRSDAVVSVDGDLDDADGNQVTRADAPGGCADQIWSAWCTTAQLVWIGQSRPPRRAY